MRWYKKRGFEVDYPGGDQGYFSLRFDSETEKRPEGR